MELLHSWVNYRYFCLFLEALISVLILALAVTVPGIGSRQLKWAERLLKKIAQSPSKAILTITLLAVGARAALLPWIPVPKPSMHDEFSYLLAGKTYAAGRITNKPPPMWPHFESVHILQRPTYMSMYPPAQGLFLAIGMRLAGQAWLGVVIGVILMSAAICWMLQGWFSAPWALVGGLLVIVRWVVFSYWVNSYWGGGIPAFAGALVAGSLPRLLRWGRIRDSIALGLGLTLLANSRPYEGLVFSAVAIVGFVTWTVKHGLSRRLWKARILTSLSLLLTVAAAATLYYNWRVSGDPLLLPYVADQQQYAVVPLFLPEKLKPEPRYQSASLRRVYEADLKLYQKGRSAAGVPEMLRKVKDFWLFYFGPLFTIPMAALLLRVPKPKDERTNFYWLIVAVSLGALLVEVWFYPHYASPMMAVIIALIVQGMRALRTWCWKGKPAGLFLSRAIPIACLLMLAVPITAAALRWSLAYWPLQWYGGTPDVVRPSSLTARFAQSHKKALIFVRYSAAHDITDEWVYNEPNLDQAPVVWAREIDRSQDAALIRYFSNRSVWLLEPDRRPLRLQPYPLCSESQRSGSNRLH